MGGGLGPCAICEVVWCLNKPDPLLVFLPAICIVAMVAGVALAGIRWQGASEALYVPDLEVSPTFVCRARGHRGDGASGMSEWSSRIWQLGRSSPSSTPIEERRRLPKLLSFRGRGKRSRWAVLVSPVILLVEGRPHGAYASVATLAHPLPPGIAKKGGSAAKASSSPRSLWILAAGNGEATICSSQVVRPRWCSDRIEAEEAIWTQL